MATNERIEVDMIVKALTEGFEKMSRDINQVGGSVDDAADAAKKGSTKWTELASGLSVAKQAFDTIVTGAKLAYDAVKQGAALDAARGKFDNLSASIGTTSGALLNDLRDATKGMVSDANLVAGATDLINLGLARSHDQVTRMSRVVGGLNLDLQVLGLTLANDSTARLDSLGLSMEDVKKKAQELQESGFVGDAFDEAVIQSLEEKMVVLGDASETTAGQIAMFEANLANLTDEAKLAAAAIGGPLIKSLNEYIEIEKKLTDATEEGNLTWQERLRLSVSQASLDPTLRATAIAYTEKVISLDKSVKDLTDDTKELSESNRQVERDYESLGYSLEIAKVNLDRLARGYEIFTSKQEAANDVLGRAAVAFNSWDVAASGAGQSIEGLKAIIEPVTLSTEAYSISVSDVVDRLREVEGQWNTSLNLSVYGLDALRDAYAIWSALQNPFDSPFNQNDQPDPTNTGGDRPDQVYDTPANPDLPPVPTGPQTGGGPIGGGGTTPGFAAGRGGGGTQKVVINANYTAATPEAIASKVAAVTVPRG